MRKLTLDDFGVNEKTLRRLKNEIADILANVAELSIDDLIEV